MAKSLIDSPGSVAKAVILGLVFSQWHSEAITDNVIRAKQCVAHSNLNSAQKALVVTLEGNIMQLQDDLRVQYA